MVGLINGEDGLSSVTVTPTGQNVLIENLYTTTDDGNIRVIVTETNGVYAEYTANFTRRDRQFQNVRIEEASVGASAGEKVTFKFTIPDEEYTEDMVVNVDMVNLVAATASTGQPGEKDKLVVATKATNSYTYTPSKAGEHTLNLETTENAAGECSVTISASGFSDDSAEVEQKSLVVYKGDISGLTSTVDIGRNRNNISYSDSSISVGGGYTISHDQINLQTDSYNGKNLTVNIRIFNLEISAESIDENTEVTIKFTVNYTDFRGNTNSKNVEVKKKISDLKSLGLAKQY